MSTTEKVIFSIFSGFVLLLGVSLIAGSNYEPAPMNLTESECKELARKVAKRYKHKGNAHAGNAYITSYFHCMR